MSIIRQATAWTPEVLAYMGAMMDGEGCFNIRNPKRGGGNDFKPRITVTNTSKPLIDWLQRLFGGTVYAVPVGRYNPNAAPAWQWSIQDSRTLGYVVESIRPYLVAKGEQADVILRFLDTMEGTGKRGPALTQETIDVRRNLYQEMRGLNQRGARA